MCLSEVLEYVLISLVSLNASFTISSLFMAKLMLRPKPVNVFIKTCIISFSCKLRSSQLLSHNETAALVITRYPVTAMVYHFLAPKGGHPTWEEHFIDKLSRCKIINEPQHEISTNVVCATSKGSDQPAHTRSLIRAFASRLNII